MKSPKVVKALSIGLACAGLILPGNVVEGGPPRPAMVGPAPAEHEETPAPDVELDRRGCLQGMVVDVQGAPVAHAVVVIEAGGQEVGRTETDGLGRFVMGPLCGSAYQLRVGHQRRLVRIWAADTAPPAAKPMVLVVLGGDVVRGQLPLEEFFASDTLVIVGLVAAMIALPVALHNSGQPVSPP